MMNLKRIFAGCAAVLVCALSSAFAADQEWDQQIRMTIPPYEDEHVATKKYVDGAVDGAELGVTNVEAPLYWKEPVTGGARTGRYVSSIQLMPGVGDGTIAYSVDGAPPVDVAVSGLATKEDVEALRRRLDELEASLNQ